MENQRIRLTRRLLKEALMSILLEKDITKITVYELCDRASVNRTTFYKYYGSPQELLEEIKDEMFDELTQKLKDVESNQSEAFVQAISCIEADIDRWRLIIFSTNAPDFVRRVLQHISLANTIDHTMNLDAAYTERQKEYIYEFLYNGSYAMLGRWISQEKRETPEEMASLLMSFLLKIKQR